MSPVKQGKEVSPVKQGKEVSPVKQGKELSPVKQGKEVSPVERKRLDPQLLESWKSAPVWNLNFPSKHSILQYKIIRNILENREYFFCTQFNFHFSERTLRTVH